MYCSILPFHAVRKIGGLKELLKTLCGASLCVRKVHCSDVNLKGENHGKKMLGKLCGMIVRGT